MREYFEKLKPREQWVIKIGGIFLIVILFYLFLWSPFTTAISNEKARVESKQSLLQWMQSSADSVQHFHAEGFEFKPGYESAPLLTRINMAFQSENLTRFFLSPPTLKGQDVEMQLGDVPFDLLMTTLDRLWKESNVVVVNIKVIQRAAPGTVNASITVVQK